MNRLKPYVVDEVPHKYRTPGSPEHLYYVHRHGYDYLCVFGSVTPDRKKANRICKIYNESVGAV